MSVLESLKENRIPFFIIGCSVVLVLAFLYLVYVAPVRGMGPRQPIPFSHRIHAGVKNIQCQFCHPYTARSTYPGLPPVEKCLYCHQYIIAQHPEIQKEHRFFKSRISTPWQKVFYLPEHVFFNHACHIRRGIECRACHGAVETVDRLKYTRFQMGFCVDCHKERKVNTDCWLACHN